MIFYGDVPFNLALCQVRNTVESTKPFVRWMDGTCIETPEQRVNGEDEEPFVFSFYADVSANPQIIKAMLILNHMLHKAVSGVNRFIENWRKHQHLWKQDKTTILDKFAAKNPSCAEFEDRLSKYAKVASDIWALPKDKDVEFLRISSHQLAAAVRDEARGWVNAIGASMALLDAQRVKDVQSKMDKLDADLNRDVALTVGAVYPAGVWAARQQAARLRQPEMEVGRTLSVQEPAN
ncbi:hypothetical protein CBR_g57828 [Chara braunii]|uniref:Uncharacterized protein n=1 Tax=Chara braunii TaxID=69332 RepID=A0A388K834_CHABU|nr:hypothetical protein CBR_g57828 [Chara braunii]|eukprot:GBG66225.1 hypothetical protein CBR_g57828 [Chara braunii]